MTIKYIHLHSIDSTNSFLRSHAPVESTDMTVVTADVQTAGRGQGTNSWESEVGKNLLFSLLIHPAFLPVSHQFLISKAMALALYDTLIVYTGTGLSVKWPNDIYWNDSKICGTLIETSLSAGRIKDFIIGTGVNVNQTVFRSDAPNPVSLFNIIRKETDRRLLLNTVIRHFEENLRELEEGRYQDISSRYHKCLYRGTGMHQYEDSSGIFMARIREVSADGCLLLEDDTVCLRRYMFKEVKFVLPSSSEAGNLTLV